MKSIDYNLKVMKNCEVILPDEDTVLGILVDAGVLSIASAPQEGFNERSIMFWSKRYDRWMAVHCCHRPNGSRWFYAVAFPASMTGAQVEKRLAERIVASSDPDSVMKVGMFPILNTATN